MGGAPGIDTSAVAIAASASSELRKLYRHSADGFETPGSWTVQWVPTDRNNSNTLIRPIFSFFPNPELFQSNEHFSVRVAPALVGLGLLESIPATQIISNWDSAQKRADGVRGNARFVPDLATGVYSIGRFGWKCDEPTVKQQVADALSEEMSLTNRLFFNSKSNQLKVTDDELHALTLYIRLLGVPMRRKVNDASVLFGEYVFRSIGCNLCHRETFRTGEVSGFPELSKQLIHPYTDLLLHDMGPGLSDSVGFTGVSASEWRTPPLWGIGLLDSVNEHPRLLHDGRARTFDEAIRWHGGEALNSKNRYTSLPTFLKKCLLDFLHSL